MIDAIPQTFIDEINDVDSILYRQKQAFINHYWLVEKAASIVRMYPSATVKICLDTILDADYHMPPEGYYLNIKFDQEGNAIIPMKEIEFTEEYLNSFSINISSLLRQRYLMSSISNILLKKYLKENKDLYRFLIFRMMFVSDNEDIGHANSIIITGNKAYILEPHGPKRGYEHDQITTSLKIFLEQFIPDIKIITISNMGCLTGFQGSDRLCAIWSIYMGILFIINKGKDIGNIYTRVINDNPSEHLINFLFFICKSDMFKYYMSNVLISSTIEHDIILRSPPIEYILYDNYLGDDENLEKYVEENFEILQEPPAKYKIKNDTQLIFPSWLDKCRDVPDDNCNKCGKIFYNPTLYMCDENKKLKIDIEKVRSQLNAKDAYDVVMKTT